MKYLESYKEINPDDIKVGGGYGKLPGVIISDKFFEKIPYIINFLKSKNIKFELFTNSVYFFIILNSTNSIDLLPYGFNNTEHVIPLSDEYNDRNKDNILNRLPLNWYENKFRTYNNIGTKWTKFTIKTSDDMIELKEYINNLLIKKSANKFNL